MDAVDFRTEKQKKLEVKRGKICDDYLILSAKEGATPMGVYRLLAKKYGYKNASEIIRILQRKGYLQ